jgi:hypothetical protein
MRPPSVRQEECTRKEEQENQLTLMDTGKKDFKMASRFPTMTKDSVDFVRMVHHPSLVQPTEAVSLPLLLVSCTPRGLTTINDAYTTPPSLTFRAISNEQQ